MGAKDSSKPFYEVLVDAVHEKKGSQFVGVEDGEDHSLENIIEGSNDVRLRDIRWKSAEQMVDFLGEAMMKKQESRDNYKNGRNRQVFLAKILISRFRPKLTSTRCLQFLHFKSKHY